MAESLVEEMETIIRQMTHDRIRDLAVREDHGRILIWGRAQTRMRSKWCFTACFSSCPAIHCARRCTVGLYDTVELAIKRTGNRTSES